MTNKAAITKSKTVATALVVVVAAAFLAVDQAKGAAPTKGDNAAAFSSLCLAINSALKPKLPPPINTEADNILNFAAAVNLTTIGSEGLSDVVSKHQKTAGDLQKDSIQSKVCEGVHWEFCSKGGKKAAELKANGDFQALRNAQISPANKLKIIATVAAIKEAAEQIQSTKTAAEDQTIATDLAEALYGQQQEPAEIKLATAETNRQAACGRTSTSTQGSLAVGSLVGTALCLCAKDSKQTAANACTTEPKYDLQIAADADINVKSDWELLKTACDAQATEAAGTPEAIAAALATLTANTAAKKSSGNYVNVLGHLPGNGAGGCDGAADGTNGGACAYYGKADETGGVARTKWAQKLATAASKLKAAYSAADEARALEQHLLQLNRTLHHITTDVVAQPAATSNNAVGAGNEARQGSGGIPCHDHNNKTAEECKALNCDHDSKTKKCKPKAEAETTVTGTGETAKEGETTEKCKGKPEKDCTSPDCKWENNACKDSSILVNKKFALSVVSAAFVALLF